MATRNPIDKQANTIAKQIALLQRKQETLRKKSRAPVIKDIVQQMREYEITPEELAQAYGSNSRRGRTQPTARAAKHAKSAVKPKYRHPNTGETWTGRGKAPRWLAAAEAAGAQREQFLIAQ
ncbi:DNA-binding protein [Achromobacter xylosoxidans]|uniref:H-NS histone family protein n=1 Tax=Achromobacter TaxID=222 RepID=UPI0008A2835E|nr:H-NS histone family protein [Achromobacter xylosoxidans]OFS61642.1 DNA-binding protein [Achromobacter xylosoxidans]